MTQHTARKPRVYWSETEVETVLQEAARLIHTGRAKSRSFCALLAQAQSVLPAQRRRSTMLNPGGSTPRISGLAGPKLAKYQARFDEILKEVPQTHDTAPTPTPSPPPAPPAPEPLRLSAQDELANYGLADLLAATLVRFLEVLRPMASAPLAVGPPVAVASPAPPRPHWPADAEPPRARKIRIAGIGFLPSQQAAIQNRLPDVDFTWIDAEQSQTYVPPSMDFAVLSRFCNHRWSEHCWRVFGQARAPRVTGGVTEVTQTIKDLLARQADLIASNGRR